MNYLREILTIVLVLLLGMNVMLLIYISSLSLQEKKETPIQTASIELNILGNEGADYISCSFFTTPSEDEPRLILQLEDFSEEGITKQLKDLRTNRIRGWCQTPFNVR